MPDPYYHNIAGYLQRALCFERSDLDEVVSGSCRLDSYERGLQQRDEIEWYDPAPGGEGRSYGELLVDTHRRPIEVSSHRKAMIRKTGAVIRKPGSMGSLVEHFSGPTRPLVCPSSKGLERRIGFQPARTFSDHENVPMRTEASWLTPGFEGPGVLAVRRMFS